MMATSKPVFTYNALQYPGGIYPGGGAVYGNYIKDYWAQVEAFEKAHPETKRAASDYYADPQAEVSGSVRPKTAEQQQIDDARSKYYDDLWKQYYKGLTPAQRAQYDSSHQARADRLKKSSNRGALIALGAPLAAAGIGALAGAGGFGALGGGAEAAGGAGGFVFNPAVDSQLASAVGGFSGLGGASIPAGVNLGSLGGIMSTGVAGAGIPIGGASSGGVLSGIADFLKGIRPAQIPGAGSNKGINWGALLGGRRIIKKALATIQALQNRNDMPQLPDFTKLAEQTAASRNAAVDAQTLANRPNQTNAMGDTSTWTMGPDGRPVQKTQFGAANQQRFDQNSDIMSKLQGQIASQAGQPLQAPAMGSAMANALRTRRVT